MLGKGKPAYQYGRFQLSIDAETGTTALLLENVNRADEHWLTLALRDAPHCPIGYMRLRPVSSELHMFEVVEVRPANGPLLPLPDGPSGIAGPSSEGNA